MLEIIALVLLCSVNRKNAMMRGRKPGAFIALTLALWIGLEFVGAAIGQAAELELGAYGLALLFAGIGGVASYFITKNCKPGQEPVPEAFANAAGRSQAPVPPAQLGQPAVPGQTPQAPVTVMSAPDDRRAVTAGIVVAVGWLALFLVQGIFSGGMHFNECAGSMTASALLGIGAYLFARQDRQLAIIGGVFGGLFAALCACSTFTVFAQVFLSRTVFVGVPFDVVVRTTLVLFAAMLACAALTLGSVKLVQKVRPRENRGKPLYASAGIAAAVMFAFLIAYRLIRAATVGEPLSSAVPAALLMALSNTVAMFFAVIFTDKLCAMQSGKLRLRGAGLVWAWVATCASGLSLIAFVFMVATQASSTNYSSAVALAICGLVGYIMLICGKRQGLYVVVGGVALMLASQFFSALGSVGTVPDVMRREYIALMIASVIGAVNPLLAWLSVRYSSRLADGAGAAAPAAKTKAASAFDLVAAICNIAMGAVIVASMLIGAIHGTRVNPAVYVVLLIGVLFAAGGIAAIALRAKNGGELPAWLRVTGIVMFVLDVLALAVVLIQLMFEVI